MSANGLTWDGEPSFEVPEGLPELEDPAFARRRAEREAQAAAQDPDRNRRLMFGENDDATWRPMAGAAGDAGVPGAAGATAGAGSAGAEGAAGAAGAGAGTTGTSNSVRRVSRGKGEAGGGVFGSRLVGTTEGMTKMSHIVNYETRKWGESPSTDLRTPQVQRIQARNIGGNEALLLALNRIWRTRYHPRTAASRSKRAVDGRRITADRLQAHRLARREARDLVRRLRATHECPRCGHRYDGPHPERHVAVAGVECPGGGLGEIRRLPRS